MQNLSQVPNESNVNDIIIILFSRFEVKMLYQLR